MAKTIVVIGGSHSGPVAVARARQFNEDARIILLEKSSHIRWVQSELRQQVGQNLEAFEASLKLKDSSFQERYQVEIRTHTQVVQLDMDARCVVAEENGHLSRIAFDSLVVATGATDKASEVEGLSGPYVASFRNHEDIAAIGQAIREGAKTALVIGCGFFGLDAAECLRQAGLQVVMVEKAFRIAPQFSLDAARVMQHKLESIGVQVHLNETAVKAVAKKGMGFVVHLASSKQIEADIVVVTRGSKPNSDLLAQAGAALNKDGTVRVDAQMATTLPHVYACGGLVAVPQVLTHDKCWLPMPSIGFRTAQIAGHNAAVSEGGFQDVFQPVAGTSIVQVAGLWFARTGLSKSEARRLYGDEQVLSVTAQGRSSELWCGGQEMVIKLLLHKENHTILGGEIWGEQGVERRIDMIALAVTNAFHVDQLIDADISYAPALGTAFDALKEAAMLAKLALLKESKVLSADQLALWLAEKKTFTLVDVSRTSAHQMLPNTINGVHLLPLEELRNRLDEIDKRYPVVVSSQSGRRAFLAQRLLQQKGFEEVYHLDGGTFWLRELQ